MLDRAANSAQNEIEIEIENEIEIEIENDFSDFSSMHYPTHIPQLDPP